MAFPQDAPILAPPKITQSQFKEVLTYRQSPAVVDSDAIYITLVQANIDPEIALGMFAAESNYGRAGYATVTLNWGNILYYSWIEQRCSSVEPYSPGNGFTYSKFQSWEDSVSCAYAPLLLEYDDDGFDTLYEATAKWLGAVPGSSRHMTYLNNIITHIDANRVYLGKVQMAAIKIVEEVWKGPIDHPFFDNPNGTQIGKFSKSFSVYSYGHFLNTVTHAVDPTWGAVRVTTGAIDGVSANKIVWINRTNVTVTPYVPPVKDCSTEIAAAVAPLEEEIVDLQSLNQEQAAVINTQELQIQELVVENNDLEAENGELESQNSLLTSELEEERQENAALADQNQALLDENETLSSDIDTIVLGHEVLHKYAGN